MPTSNLSTVGVCECCGCLTNVDIHRLRQHLQLFFAHIGGPDEDELVKLLDNGAGRRVQEAAARVVLDDAIQRGIRELESKLPESLAHKLRRSLQIHLQVDAFQLDGCRYTSLSINS
jgi:hypothetical protein